MIRSEQWDSLIDILPDAYWMEIIRAKEDGILPPCCGNIGHMRDCFVDFVAMPYLGSAASLAQSLTTHELPEMLVKFHRELVKLLNSDSVDWQGFKPPLGDNTVDLYGF